MTIGDLVPWARKDRSSDLRTRQPDRGGSNELTPFFRLHDEMNRLFEDAFRAFDVPAMRGAWPSLEMQETDGGYRISAELPGMDEKDVEILVDDDVLTIRGEKRSQTEDKDRHFSERYYGRFERSIALPFEVEDDKAEATFKNGVLTVALPKSARTQEKAKRIAINAKSDTKH